MAKENTVTCLGKTFANEEERRDYFRNVLRKKLPELKKIEGFPIGEDEDIIALSDPPFYTACPNPWVNDFINEWEARKIATLGRNENFRVDGPYAADIKEGKNHPVYTAHSYHTKVPHQVIMRYLLHYTQPGDIVLDGFAGTGMTGIAAQLCGSPDIELKYKIEKEWDQLFDKPPVWGGRKAIISDLSPIASFVSYNYNSEFDSKAFAEEAERILDKIESEYGWMYETKSTDGKKGKITYIVWSDILQCNHCGGEINYWKAAVNYEKRKVLETFSCPHCKAQVEKSGMDKFLYSKYDDLLGLSIRQTKMEPVLINYSIGKKRFEKTPDGNDIKVIQRIQQLKQTTWVPTNRMPEGGETRRNDKYGFTHVHHFYTKRNLLILGAILSEINESNNDDRMKHYLMNWFHSSHNRLHLFNRYAANHQRHVGPLANTLYISSTPTEISPFYFAKSKIKDNTIDISVSNEYCQSIVSATDLSFIRDKSIDYIFTDPPFGANIMYSELNSILESWMKLLTANNMEAVENRSQGKGKPEYQSIMERCFAEYFRVLKSGRWMSVEFSNTSAAIWNAIQFSLQKAGFVITSITDLDKGRAGLHGIIGVVAVNQDLVITCYKPSGELQKSIAENKPDVSLIDFLNEHLNRLPIHIRIEDKTSAIVERNPKIIYDRLISHYIMKGLSVPIDAKDFQDILKLKFVERDGMFFTKDQAVTYDEKKATAPIFVQLSLLVTTENEGIEWLRQEISGKSQTYQDLQPKWMQSITAVRKGDILPELMDILKENFIGESDGKWRLPDLNEAKDREALRKKTLLKEFESFIEELNSSKSKKLKEVRVEALRAGFKSCWEKKDFQTIVLMSERIPQTILLEDEHLLMYYDIAKDRV